MGHAAASAGTERSGPFDFSNVQDQRRAFMQRWTALKAERTTWRDHWYDISRHVLPRNGRFFISDRNRTSSSRYNKIYDNTPTQALRTLGAGMMAGASNPARPWFRLTTADPHLADSYEVKVWLDDVVERMSKVFAKSNTYRTLHSMYEELGAFGTSVSLVLPDFDNVIHHYPIACGEYCLQLNYKGEVQTLYREFQKTVGETVKEFGMENCSRSVQDAWTNRHHERTVDILHVIEPREDQARNPDSPAAKDMPFKSCYLETGGDNDKLLRESGFKRFPVLAPRWAVAGGDVYGVSPGMEALGDIRQLQQEQLRKGQAIDYQVRPPLQVPTGVKNRGQEMFPGGLNYVDPGTTLPYDQATPHGGIRSAFDVKIDLSHLLEDIHDCRGRIRSSFHADLFLMLTNMDRTQMTAHEVAERHEEKLLVLGPTVERLHNEQLHPLVDITFDHMNEAGLLPPPPEELQGAQLNVEFVSVLAQAQRAVGSAAVDRFIGNIAQVATTVAPDVSDKVNFDKWADDYADMLGIPADMMVSDADVLALRQSRAAAQAEQEQAALNQQKAATMKDAGSVPTDERNPVADMLTQAGEETPR